jgi:hypothetical protein
MSYPNTEPFSEAQISRSSYGGAVSKKAGMKIRSSNTPFFSITR